MINVWSHSHIMRWNIAGEHCFLKQKSRILFTSYDYEKTFIIKSHLLKKKKCIVLYQFISLQSPALMYFIKS